MGGRPPKPRYAELVDLTYGLTSGPPSLRFRFRGDPGPFCEVLDDCGAHGQLVLQLPTRHSTMDLEAFRTVRSRQTSRQILNDLRADPAAFDFSGFAALPASVAETLSWGGGLVCPDTVTSPPVSPEPVVLAEPVVLSVGSLSQYGAHAKQSETGGEVPASLSATGTDILRTHCPGPTSEEVLGEQGLVGRARLSARSLLAKQDVIDFARPGTFNVPGYSGRRSGGLEFRLSLLKMATRTRLER